MDNNGNPLQGRRIRFSTAVPGAALTQFSEQTGEDGSIRARWTVGSAYGIQAVAVTDLDNDSGEKIIQEIKSQVCARSDSIVRMRVSAGDGQTPLAYQSVSAAISVGGVDAAGAPSSIGCDGATFLAKFEPESEDDVWLDYPGDYIYYNDWKGTFRLPGVRHIIANAKYLPSLIISVTVLENPHSFDGYYWCSLPWRSFGMMLQNSRSSTIVGNVYSDNTLDEATGDFTGVLYESLDYESNLVGKFEMDSLQRGNGKMSGIGYFHHDTTPGEILESGALACTRFDSPGSKIGAAPLGSFRDASDVKVRRVPRWTNGSAVLQWGL